jgi:hypothetical protein
MHFGKLGLGMFAAVMLLAACVSSGAGPPGSAGTGAGTGGATGAGTGGRIATIGQAIGTLTSLQDKIETAKNVVTGTIGGPQAAVRLDEALIAYDKALSGIDFLVEVGVLKRNTPPALAVRTGVVKVKHALLAAIAAHKSGLPAATITQRLSEASTALAEIRKTAGV